MTAVNPIQVDYGNRCGHDKSVLRGFAAPAQHKGRPDILIDASQKAGRFYIEHDRYLIMLRLVNGSSRQQRSERREAAAAVLQVLLHYTDLSTLQVGTPRASGEINGLRIKFIAEKLGFHDKRVWRAINDLRHAGYLRITTRLTKVSTKIFSISTISLHPQTFYDLGVGQLRLQMSRHYKNKSLAKQGNRRLRTIKGQGSRQARQSLAGMGQLLAKKSKPSFKKEPSQRQLIAQRKQQHEAIYHLMTEKGITTAEAMRQLKLTTLH